MNPHVIPQREQSITAYRIGSFRADQSYIRKVRIFCFHYFSGCTPLFGESYRNGSSTEIQFRTDALMSRSPGFNNLFRTRVKVCENRYCTYKVSVRIIIGFGYIILYVQAYTDGCNLQTCRSKWFAFANQVIYTFFLFDLYFIKNKKKT